MLAWIIQSLFWFVPGLGRLLFEHALWQEAWADADSRECLRIEPRAQATELLNAIAKGSGTPHVALGFHGEAKTVSRRIEAMFVRRHSALLAVLALLLVGVLLVPVRLEAKSAPGIRLYSPVARMLR
jgi:hypothetical protein